MSQFRLARRGNNSESLAQVGRAGLHGFSAYAASLDEGPIWRKLHCTSVPVDALELDCHVTALKKSTDHYHYYYLARQNEASRATVC